MYVEVIWLMTVIHEYKPVLFCSVICLLMINLAASEIVSYSGSTFRKSNLNGLQRVQKTHFECAAIQGSAAELSLRSSKKLGHLGDCASVERRKFIKLSVGILSLLTGSTIAEAAGLPPEEMPKLCDDACAKELENVW